MCSWKTQHSANVNFAKTEKTRGTFSNYTHSDPILDLQIRNSRDEARHVLFRRTHPHSMLFWYIADNASFPVILRFIGLRVLFSICLPHCHQPSAKKSINLFLDVPMCSLPKQSWCPLATMRIFLRSNSEPSANMKGISHIIRSTHYEKGLALVPQPPFFFPPPYI